MIKKLFCPSEARPAQNQSDQSVQSIPEHVTIVVARRSSGGMAASMYEEIPASPRWLQLNMPNV